MSIKKSTAYRKVMVTAKIFLFDILTYNVKLSKR
jgi:hypothetical protein